MPSVAAAVCRLTSIAARIRAERCSELLIGHEAGSHAVKNSAQEILLSPARVEPDANGR